MSSDDAREELYEEGTVYGIRPHLRQAYEQWAFDKAISDASARWAQEMVNLQRMLLGMKPLEEDETEPTKDDSR